MADLLNIGKSGLFAAKKSLETTGHNISNANTEGYSRQRVNQTTNSPIVKAGLAHGTGTRIQSVTRFHDTFIEKKLNKQHSSHEYFKQRVQSLEQVENIFNEIDTKGLNQLLNRFYNSFRELANQPENSTMRLVIRDSADIVIKDFNRIHDTLTGLSRSVDMSIEKNVIDINTLTGNIAKLNKEIISLENIAGESGDLRDQRDLAIKNLSELFEVHTYKDNKNNYVVSAKGIGTLVVGGQTQELMAGSAPADKATVDIPGSFEIFFKDRPQHSITNSFQNGKLSAMIKVRNGDLKSLRDKMDKTAFEFSKTVNAVHKRGYVGRQIPIAANGKPASSDSKGPTTGINFFNDLTSEKGASKKLKLSEAVKGDLTNIVTALSPNAPGDNRIAIAISKLQHEKILEGGTTTLEENYLQTIAEVGLQTGKAKLDQEQTHGVFAQTQQIKQRLVGVSIDEETANMIRYQHAFDASAKVMKTAEEMFKTVLNIKR